jgi:hypothetical protein
MKHVSELSRSKSDGISEDCSPNAPDNAITPKRLAIFIRQVCVMIQGQRTMGCISNQSNSTAVHNFVQPRTSKKCKFLDVRGFIDNRLDSWSKVLQLLISPETAGQSNERLLTFHGLRNSSNVAFSPQLTRALSAGSTALTVISYLPPFKLHVYTQSVGPCQKVTASGKLGMLRTSSVGTIARYAVLPIYEILWSGKAKLLTTCAIGISKHHTLACDDACTD